MEANGLPSRTSILTAAARAFGSREPDVSVRNPDWLAERLIGPAELALIAEHPISKALDRDFQDAINDPDVFGFAWLMLVRTRFTDERLEHAIRNGATQVVIMGAGFDTRAHRFAELLQGTPVIEIDYGATQLYKKQRVEAALGRRARQRGLCIDRLRARKPGRSIASRRFPVRTQNLLHLRGRQHVRPRRGYEGNPARDRCGIRSGQCASP